MINYLICLMGAMGSGKTYLAQNLAKITGWPSLHSDKIRKKISGLEWNQHSYDNWEQGIYNKKNTLVTYQKLFKETILILTQGESVIIDASFRTSIHRQIFLTLAQYLNVEPLFIELTAKYKVLIQRLNSRQNTKNSIISDGRVNLLNPQIKTWEINDPLLLPHILKLKNETNNLNIIDLILSRLKKMGYININIKK